LLKDFSEYSVDFTYSGWTGATEEVEDTEIIIINSENFQAKFKNVSWFVDVNLLIVDECHKVGHGTKLSDLIHKIKTPNKFGFTGTLSKNNLDRWKTIGTFGPILIQKPSKELRDENYLTSVSAVFLKLIHHKAGKFGYKDELEYLYNCKERNECIFTLAENIKNNTLILVNHHEHMDNIKETFSGSNKKIVYIKGETSVEDRAKAILQMEANNDVICVAMASVFSTGINIKNLHNIFIIAGGKSFIRLVQGIGRGLRLHNNKYKLTIIDVYDNLNYSEEHAEHRKGIYDDEQIPWTEKEKFL
jgi:superfamily II DNA or RNA helicase